MSNKNLYDLDPEYFERVPVRTELTVLPGDDPNLRPTINWTIREYDGSPVKLLEEVDGEEVVVDGVLTERGDLQDGTRILCPALFGYFRATVKVGEDGELYAKGTKLTGFLRFDGDDRHCWTCWGAADLESILKLHITR